MLKAIAVADLHLKMVPGVPKKWQIDRYHKFFNLIIEQCVEKKSILILAGDTLDSVAPKKEELSLFFQLLHGLNAADITTLIVSGNHETLKTGSSILDYLEIDQFDNVIYRSKATIQGVTFHLVNHDSLADYVPDLSEYPTKNVLVSHFRCNYSKFVTEEINVEKFIKPYDMCIVGDIHDNYEDGKLYYTNNPVNKEFEKYPSCGYLEIDFEMGYQVKRVSVDLPKLRYLKTPPMMFKTAWELPAEDFFELEVEGTPEELRHVPNKISNGIVRKIPVLPNVLKIEQEEAEELNISGEASEEDLALYMKSLKYSDELIVEMLSELRREE